MADQTPKQDRYNSDVTKIAQDERRDMNKTLNKVPTHQGEDKVTRSTEGNVETTTTERK